MASRSKRKGVNNLQKTDSIEKKELSALLNSKKVLNDRLSGILMIGIVILLILVLSVPVVDVNLKIDLESIAQENEDEDGEIYEYANNTANMKLSALEIMLAPANADGDVFKFIVNKSGIAKNEQGQKIVLLLINGLLTNEEKEELSMVSILLLVTNYIMAFLLLFMMVSAFLERKAKDKYLFTFISMGAFSFVSLFELVFEFIMLTSSSKNTSVSVAWGIFIITIIALALVAYLAYHHTAYMKIKAKEKSDEKVS